MIDAIHSRFHCCFWIIARRCERGSHGNIWFCRARAAGTFHAHFHAIHEIVYHYRAKVAGSVQLEKSPAACLLGSLRQINAVVCSQAVPVRDVLDGTAHTRQQPFITAELQFRSPVVSVHDRLLRALRTLRGNPGNNTGRPRTDGCRLAIGNRCSTSRNRTFLPAYRTERKLQVQTWDAPRLSCSKY